MGKPEKKISEEAQKLLDRKNEKKREKQELTTRTNKRDAFIRKYADIIRVCNEQPDLNNAHEALKIYLMRRKVDHKTLKDIILLSNHADEYTRKGKYHFDYSIYDDYL